MRFSDFSEQTRRFERRCLGGMVALTLAFFALVGFALYDSYQRELPSHCVQQLPDVMSGRCPNDAHRLSVVNGLAICTCPARLA